MDVYLFILRVVSFNIAKACLIWLLSIKWPSYILGMVQ